VNGRVRVRDLVVSCGPVSVQVLPQIVIKDALTVQLEGQRSLQQVSLNLGMRREILPSETSEEGRVWVRVGEKE
jgi:hypothetical protein